VRAEEEFAERVPNLSAAELALSCSPPAVVFLANVHYRRDRTDADRDKDSIEGRDAAPSA
jgi:hypothetical protein